MPIMPGTTQIGQTLNYRISRKDLYIVILSSLALRSTCIRSKVGAILVSEDRIISLGYVGSPPGQPHCIDPGIGCQIDPDTGGCIRTLHAESNAIAFAGRAGIATLGCHLYISLSPCLSCAKLIAAAGIVAVHYQAAYRDPRGLELLKACGIGVHVL